MKAGCGIQRRVDVAWIARGDEAMGLHIVDPCELHQAEASVSIGALLDPRLANPWSFVRFEQVVVVSLEQILTLLFL